MSKELGFTPERYNGKSYIHWYCKKTGDVLDTVEVGGSNGEAHRTTHHEGEEQLPEGTG